MLYTIVFGITLQFFFLIGNHYQILSYPILESGRQFKYRVGNRRQYWQLSIVVLSIWGTDHIVVINSDNSTFDHVYLRRSRFAC